MLPLFSSASASTWKPNAVKIFKIKRNQSPGINSFCITHLTHPLTMWTLLSQRLQDMHYYIWQRLARWSLGVFLTFLFGTNSDYIFQHPLQLNVTTV